LKEGKIFKNDDSYSIKFCDISSKNLFSRHIPPVQAEQSYQRSFFMKKTFKLIGIIALAAVIGLSMTTCENGEGGDIPVTFSSVSADGSSSQTTAQLTLTFSQAITGLTADNISLSGVDGVSKGNLSGSGPVYTLPISGFTSGGTLSVAVSKSGYEISGSPQSTDIYYYSAPVDIPVTFSSVSANGSSSQTTAQLTLTFSQAISGLTENDITLSGVDGVIKGTLSGSGPTYTLPIGGFALGGTLSVAAAKSGYDISGSPQSTTIYKNADDISVSFYSVSADGSSSETTAQLTLTFSQAITGLTADDISLSGVSGVIKGTLSGSGPTYTLPVSGFTLGGTLSVTVIKSGYDISGSPKPTTIYYYRVIVETEVTVINYWADDTGGLSIGTEGGPIAGNTVTVEPGGSITFAAGDSGYSNHSWTLNGVFASADAEYTFDASGKHQGQDYIVGLRVQKDGKFYFTQITVRIEE
jgi:hypothetical protein